MPLSAVTNMIKAVTRKALAIKKAPSLDISDSTIFSSLMLSSPIQRSLYYLNGYPSIIQKSMLTILKPHQPSLTFYHNGSGGWIRTNDTRVVNPMIITWN